MDASIQGMSNEIIVENVSGNLAISGMKVKAVVKDPNSNVNMTLDGLRVQAELVLKDPSSYYINTATSGIGSKVEYIGINTNDLAPSIDKETTGINFRVSGLKVRLV